MFSAIFCSKCLFSIHNHSVQRKNIDPCLVTVDRGLAFAREEEGGGVLVEEGDEDGGRHVQGLGVGAAQVARLVDHHLAL